VALSRLLTAFLLPFQNLKSSVLSLRFPFSSSFSIGWKISALCDENASKNRGAERNWRYEYIFYTPFAQRERDRESSLFVSVAHWKKEFRKSKQKSSVFGGRELA
jgi:hypothetical protein